MHGRRCYGNLQRVARSYSSSSSATASKNTSTHFVFGANTDIGKTVLTAALVRASAAGDTTSTHYIKPLQCGGSDEAFLRKHASNHLSSVTTLFEWETPASPHLAARLEDKPVSDQEVVKALSGCLDELESKSNGFSSIWVETAGGVMSPSSSSPQNQAPHHSKDAAGGWGWVTQADLYGAFRERSSVVLIGDGRLGGISSTLTALEALLHRNYAVGGILLLRDDDSDSSDPNVQALREYAASYPLSKQSSSSIFANPEKSIISLPTLPPEPEPLDEWYASSDVQGPMSSFVQDHLFHSHRVDNS